MIHVGEQDAVGVLPELGLERVELRRAQHHQDRLFGGHGVADEPQGSVHELIAVRVEERLMAISAVAHFVALFADHARHRRPTQARRTK